MAKPAKPESRPGLLPERKVAERYEVSTRTLIRWDTVKDLGFPPPVFIRRRRYRSIAALDKFDRDSARKAVDDSAHWAEGQPRAKRGRFKKKPAKRAHQHAAR
jgi:hypothetical protein